MEEYFRHFLDFVTFSFNDDYKQTLQAEKGHFYPFEEKGRGLDHQDPSHTCERGYMQRDNDFYEGADTYPLINSTA